VNDQVDDRSGAIDYDSALSLDAEELAERGIAAAFAELSAQLRELGIEPASVEEHVDPDVGVYAAHSGGISYSISGPSIPVSHCWGLATYALFDIVNRQLAGHSLKFYAINGGNDLFGIFMTPAQSEHARNALPRKADWPYMPTPEPGWFGMHHD
jgi:hypothetical protein